LIAFCRKARNYNESFWGCTGEAPLTCRAASKRKAVKNLSKSCQNLIKISAIIYNNDALGVYQHELVRDSFIHSLCAERPLRIAKAIQINYNRKERNTYE